MPVACASLFLSLARCTTRGNIQPAIRQVEGLDLVIEKGKGNRRLLHDHWLTLIHGMGPPVLLRLSGLSVQQEQAFHPIVAVSPLLCKHGANGLDSWYAKVSFLQKHSQGTSKEMQ